MIPLAKGPAPEVLIDNGPTWTADYMAAKAADLVTDTIRYRYRHSQIKNALRRDAFGKCSYCESQIPVGETDHILPVSERPELICDWNNLALACKECNTNKSDYYAPAEPLINPYIEDPARYLLVFGPLVLARAGNDKGRRTVLKLKLDRLGLLERRAERVKQLQSLVIEYVKKAPGPTKDLLAQALRDEASANSEYAAIVRAYLFQELGWTFDPGAPMAA